MVKKFKTEARNINFYKYKNMTTKQIAQSLMGHVLDDIEEDRTNENRRAITKNEGCKSKRIKKEKRKCESKLMDGTELDWKTFYKVALDTLPKGFSIDPAMEDWVCELFDTDVPFSMSFGLTYGEPTISGVLDVWEDGFSSIIDSYESEEPISEIKDLDDLKDKINMIYDDLISKASSWDLF